MKKKLSILMLLAALIVPWASRAQNCTQTVPYSENFESYTGVAYNATSGRILPTCWNGYTTVTNYVPCVVSGTGSYVYYHGAKSLAMTGGTATTYGMNKYVLLPPMDVPLNQLQISFWMCTEQSSSTYGTLHLGYVTADDTATFVSIASYPSSSATVHNGNGVQAAGVGLDVEYVLSQVPASATRLAFKWEHGNSSYHTCCIDDIVVSYPPTCPRIDNLTAAPSSDEVVLSWLEMGNATEWEVTITDATGVVSSNIVYTNPATISNLTANTSYSAMVRAVCGYDDTSLVRSIDFRTLCAAISNDSLPYTYGFEDATGSGASYAINSCWGRHTNYTTAYPYPSSTQKHSGSYALYFYSTSAYHSYVTLPPFEDDIEDLYLTFWAYKTSANYGHVYVGVMSNPDALSTFDTIATLQVNAVSTWEFFEVPLSSYAGNGGVLALLSPSLSAANYVYIDDITIGYPPACPTPFSIVGSNATSNSVDLSWTSTGDEFIVEYGRKGFTQGHGDSLVCYSNSITLSNLSMGMTYDVYVTAICSGDTSNTAHGTVTAGCGALTDADLPYTEDFEAYGTGTGNPINPCWNKGVVNSGTSSTTTTYPYPYSTAAINGTRGLYFYAAHTSTYHYYNWMTLPPIDATLNMSDLMVTFLMKRTSSTSTSTTTYTSRLIVGVSSDITSATAFVPVDTIDFSTAAASSVHEVEVDFSNYSGNGTYIMFYAPAPANTTSSNYNAFYVDDITLRAIPTCFWPTEVVLDSLSHDAVSISWTPDSRTPSPSSWSIEYGPEGFTPGTGTTTMATDTFAVIDNLLPDHVYDIYVSADCGSDVSDGRLISVHTACVPIDSLPYFEGFEAYGNTSTSPISACWTKAAIDNTTAYPYPSSTAAITGERGLYFYGYKSSTNARASYAALPLFVDELTDLFVEFDLKRYSSTSTTYHTVMQVGVMTDPNDISTFQLLENIDLDNTPASSIHHYRVSFEYYTGNGQYIAFYAPTPTTNSHYNYVYLDNVNVDLLPTCRWPEGLTVDSIGAYDVRLAWLGSATSYEVEASTNAAFDTIVVSDVVYDTFALLTGLDELSNYYFRVRGLCSGDSSLWSSPASARTARDCGQNSINIVDTIGNGTSSASTYTFHSSSTYRTGFSSTIYTVTELNNMGLQTNNRINGIKLHSGATGGTIRKAKVYLKETTLDAIGSTVANDTVDRSTMTLVYSGNLVVPANSWVEILFDSAFTYSGNSNLLVNLCHDTNATAGVTFYYTTTSPDYLSLYGYRSTATAAQNSVYRTYYRPNIVFDICTEVPTCMRPSDVAVTGLTDTSISLAWTHVADNYEVLVSTTQVDPDTVVNATIYTTDSNGYTITGLQPNTQYYMYVRSDCGSIGYSEWSLEVEGRTACAPETLPYSENFDSYSAGTTAAAGQTMSPCWRKGTNSSTAYPYLYTTNSHSAPNGLYMYGTASYYSYAALPLMADSVRHLMMSFSAYKSSATYGKIWVGVMTDPNDFSTFQRYQRVNVSAVSTWENFEVDFSGYTGPEGCIAFTLHDSAANYAVIDDIMVDTIPSCPRVRNVTVNNITQTGATVHWNASPYDASVSFDIEYGPHGFAHGTGTTVNSSLDSVDLIGLNHSTMYDVYVRAQCSATDEGPWSFVYSFYTACGVLTVPYTEDFENYGTGSSFGIHPCWHKGTNSSTAYPYPYATNAITGNRSLYFYSYHPSSTSTTALYSYAALPEFNVPVNNLEITFNMRRYSTTTNYYTSLIVVGVMTNPTDINTFEAIDTIDLKDAAALSVHEINVSFASYTDTGKYIALYAPVPPLYGESYSYNYTYIDDINVMELPPCPRVYDLTASNGTTTSATIGWTDTIGSTQWVIEYGLYGDTATTTVTVNSNPYTITGLTPNTTYHCRVAPICSDGTQSDWSRTWLTFGTAYNPAPLPYNYDFEGAAEWANWQTSTNDTTGRTWYRGTSVADSGSYSMYVATSATASYHSYSFNALVNAAAYRDIDFGTVDSSYTLSFRARAGGTTTNYYDGLMVFLIDPALSTLPSNTSITTPWGNVNNLYRIATVRLDTTWQTYEASFDTIHGVKRVAFFWFNQNTGASYTNIPQPAAVDNIHIKYSSCPRPLNLAAPAVASTSATLTWTGASNANYEVVYRVVNGTNHFIYTSTNSITLSGLNSLTTYRAWVRKVCGVGDTSLWSDGVEFVTPMCDNVTEFYTGDGTSTNNQGPVNNFYKHTLTQTIVDSSELAGIGDIAYIAYSYSYATASTKKTDVNIWLQPTNLTEFANTDAVPLNPATAVKVYHGALNCSQGWNYFPLDTTYTWDGHSNLLVIVQDNSGQYDGTNYHFNITATTDYKYLIYYRDGTVGVDTISAYNPSSFTASTKYRYQRRPTMKLISCGAGCTAPGNLMTTSVTYNAATITWTGSDSTEVGIHQGLWDESGATMINVTPGVHTYTFTGLTPNTQYTVAARTLCEDDMTSSWVYVTFTTDDLPCFAPTNIQVSNETTNGGKITWTPGGNETEWIVNVFRTGIIDTNYTVINTPMCNVSGLYAATTYTISVASVCGGIDTVWCDTTATLTTTACLPPTNVEAVANGHNAIVTWEGSGANEYHVLWYLEDFTTGADSVVVTNGTTNATITGLAQGETYDIYVYAYCDGQRSAQAGQTQVTITGIDDVNSSLINLYPNPANTTVTVDGIQGEAIVTIVDMNGRTVFSEKAVSKLTIDLGGMAKGAYFVRITGENTTAIRKLIVK